MERLKVDLRFGLWIILARLVRGLAPVEALKQLPHQAQHVLRALANSVACHSQLLFSLTLRVKLAYWIAPINITET